MKKLLLRLSPVLALAPLLLAPLPGCNNGGGDDGLNDSAAASTYDGAVARAWMNELYSLIKAGGTTPPPAARIFAYAGIALYESCVPGMPDHQTLGGQLGLPADPLPALPVPQDEKYHWPSAANRALAVITSSFFPGSQAAIDALEDGFDTTFDTTVDADMRARSIQFGEDVANAVILWASTDGFVAGNNNWCGYVAPVAPGSWTPIAPATGIGLLPCWGTLRTFAVTDGAECAAVPPPAFSAASTSEIYAEALQVFNVSGSAGANLSNGQKAIAKFWADNATATGTPGGHWISVVGIVTSQPGYDQLDIAAEAYARVGLAIGDAFITCWNTKYVYYLLRPTTYIIANIPGGAGFTSYIGTPNFPTYSSGHSTQSGAAVTVLTDMFGPIPFTDNTHQTLNLNLSDALLNPTEFGFYAARDFDNFFQAGNEAAVSRLYGGIHYAFDNVEGFNSGQCVGSIIDANVHFLK